MYLLFLVLVCVCVCISSISVSNTSSVSVSSSLLPSLPFFLGLHFLGPLYVLVFQDCVLPLWCTCFGTKGSQRKCLILAVTGKGPEETHAYWASPCPGTCPLAWPFEPCSWYNSPQCMIEVMLPLQGVFMETSWSQALPRGPDRWLSWPNWLNISHKIPWCM